MDLDPYLSDALAELARANAERDRWAERAADLAVEVEGLRKAIDRHGSKTEVEVIDPNQPNPWLNMARTEAILAVLSDDPISPNDVVTQLHKLGRDDEYNAVSAALAHLKTTGKAHTKGRGMWVKGRSVTQTILDAGVLAMSVAMAPTLAMGTIPQPSFPTLKTDEF